MCNSYTEWVQNWRQESSFIIQVGTGSNIPRAHIIPEKLGRFRCRFACR